MRYLAQRAEFLKTLKETGTNSDERINIALDEYLHMFDEYADMKAEVDRLEGFIRGTNALIAKLGIPEHIIESIDLSSVTVECLDDAMGRNKMHIIRFKTPLDR